MKGRAMRHALRAVSVYALLFIASWLSVIMIDPYVTFMTALNVQVANALPVSIATIVVAALTRRPLFAYLSSVGCYSLLIYIDHVKAAVLHEHVTYADFRVVPMLLTNSSLVLGFAAHSPLKLIVGLPAMVICAYVSWRFCRLDGHRTPHLLIAGLGILMLSVGVLPATGFMQAHPEWVVFQQAQEAPDYGVLANILYGWRATGSSARPNVNGDVRRLSNNPMMIEASKSIVQASGLAPDIILVQSESLFDPSTMCNTPNESALPQVSSSKYGTLEVPVFGGRTLQTEFEVLSGVPTHLFPSTEFAYLDLIHGSLHGLPYELEQLGYRTIAIHPNGRDFWRRSYALPALGFQTFIDIDAFSDQDVNERGHVSDDALISSAISELDADSGPAFIFLVTIENHGPWATPGRDDEFDMYTKMARRADSAWGNLIAALKTRARPSIALIYGDHLPGLVDTYKQRCFKDGLPPEAHAPPVAAWSNVRQLREPPKASFLIPGWILDNAQLPKSNAFTLNAELGIAAERHGLDALHRLLPDYAPVAISLVDNQVDMAPSVLLDRASIASALGTALVKGKHGPWVPQDILFDTLEGDGSRAVLALGSAYESITFRAYPSDSTCRTTHPIAISIDGRRVGTIGSGPGATLATVRTTGAQTLELVRLRSPSAMACPAVILRVVQMARDMMPMTARAE